MGTVIFVCLEELDFLTQRYDQRGTFTYSLNGTVGNETFYSGGSCGFPSQIMEEVACKGLAVSSPDFQLNGRNYCSSSDSGHLLLTLMEK